MVEAFIEASVKNEIEKCGIDSIEIIGAWDVAAPGEVKAVESRNADVLCSVAVGVREYEAFMNPWATVNGTISLSVRADVDPTGEKMLAAAERLMAMFQGWQMSMDEVINVFDVEGFEASGFNLAGGEIPRFDEETCCWTCSQVFQVKGCF